MKLNILSDLHLGFGPLERPINGADVVVLAGDVSRPLEAAVWALGIGKPVVYVAGNHEFYGSSLDGAAAELHRLCAGTQVHVLDCSAVVIGGVRFLGATLWTDFALAPTAEARTQAAALAVREVRDFSRIRLRADDPALFTPTDASALFAQHAAWLDAQLRQVHDGATVVVTHHAPSVRSIHQRFAGSPLNAAFVSDAPHLLDGRRAALWIHGHTHDSFDYVLNGTRVLCNPRGYAHGSANENALFDPHLVVDLA